MKQIIYKSVLLAALVVAALLVLPVFGADSPMTITIPSATQAKPVVSVTVSAASITAGQPVTVSGTARAR